MPKLKLSYFDFNGGRGEAARLAMVLGGIPLEDHRIPVADWPTVREGTPFHAVPVLEVADLKVLVWTQNLRSGILDHIPKDLVDRVAPRLAEHSDRLSSDPGIAAYYDEH